MKNQKKLNLMLRISDNVFLGQPGESVFHTFLRLPSMIGGSLIPFRIFVDHVTILCLSPQQYIGWSSL